MIFPRVSEILLPLYYTVVEESGKKYYRRDILWHYLSTLRDPDGSYHFGWLSAVTMLILVIPHSNAEEERVFSMVIKIIIRPLFGQACKFGPRRNSV